jgi:hypothetical protein
MSHGGKRAGAGRKKGSAGKKTLAIEDRLSKLGCDPIAGMAKIAEEAMLIKDYQLAGSMYKELAQYVAPKRKAVEVSGNNEAPLAISNIELVAPDVESED